MADNVERMIERFRVDRKGRVRLKDFQTDWAGEEEFEELSKSEIKERAKAFLTRNVTDLSAAQEVLYASDTYSVLMVLQAMDAAGKDGTIKHVMSGINPQGCEVASFKQPSAEELDHNFLWRYSKALPQRGHVGIFNRSYYEEVLVVRVHPEWLDRQKLPPGKRGPEFWKNRYKDINRLERHLARNGTAIIKIFLHVSKAEQKRRFTERLENPRKHWKFSAADLAERAHWDAYMSAYEDAIGATATRWAPWYIIPADHKYVARTLVAAILTRTIQSLDLKFPEPSAEQMGRLAEARVKLLAEKD